MKTLVWNCRGVGGPLTIPQLKEMIYLHFPSIVFLSETKNKKTVMEKVKRQLKFDQCYVVEPVGKAGGLTLFWKEEVQVESITDGNFFIEVKIKDLEAKCEWWLVGVYASTDENIRKEQWRKIEEKKKDWGDLWILVGDFNDIRSGEEKWGGGE